LHLQGLKFCQLLGKTFPTGPVPEVALHRGLGGKKWTIPKAVGQWDDCEEEWICITAEDA